MHKLIDCNVFAGREKWPFALADLQVWKMELISTIRVSIIFTEYQCMSFEFTRAKSVNLRSLAQCSGKQSLFITFSTFSMTSVCGMMMSLPTKLKQWIGHPANIQLSSSRTDLATAQLSARMATTFKDDLARTIAQYWSSWRVPRLPDVPHSRVARSHTQLQTCNLCCLCKWGNWPRSAIRNYRRQTWGQIDTEASPISLAHHFSTTDPHTSSMCPPWCKRASRVFRNALAHRCELAVKCTQSVKASLESGVYLVSKAEAQQGRMVLCRMTNLSGAISLVWQTRSDGRCARALERLSSPVFALPLFGTAGGPNCVIVLLMREKSVASWLDVSHLAPGRHDCEVAVWLVAVQSQ